MRLALAALSLALVGCGQSEQDYADYKADEAVRVRDRVIDSHERILLLEQKVERLERDLAGNARQQQETINWLVNDAARQERRIEQIRQHYDDHLVRQHGAAPE